MVTELQGREAFVPDPTLLRRTAAIAAATLVMALAAALGVNRAFRLRDLARAWRSDPDLS